MLKKESVELFIKKVNRRIAEIRIRNGITQAELAERMNVEVRDIQKWETDKSMTLRTIFRFKIALNCHAIELFQEPTTKKPGRGRPKAPKAGTVIE